MFRAKTKKAPVCAQDTDAFFCVGIQVSGGEQTRRPQGSEQRVELRYHIAFARGVRNGGSGSYRAGRTRGTGGTDCTRSTRSTGRS